MMRRKQNVILEAKKVARKYANVICAIFSIIFFFVIRGMFYGSRDRKGDLLVFSGFCVFIFCSIVLSYITIYKSIYTDELYNSFKERYLPNSKFIEVVPRYNEYLINLSKVANIYATAEDGDIVIYIRFKNKSEYYYYKHETYDITDFYKEFYIK